jgi:hypothetical protein
MPSQSSPNLSAPNLTGTVLDNLQPGSPLQPQISATLNAALKSQLAAAATAAKLPALVGLINSMPAADLVASKDLTLQAFVQQLVDPMVSGDPAMKTAVDSEIAKLPATGTVSTTLNLSSPLASHPLLKNIVSDAQITSLLAASPALTSDLQARFVTLYDANTGSMSDFWSKLASDPQLGPVVPQLQLTLQLGTLTSNNADLVTKLIAQFNPTSVRDLTKVSAAQLIQLMTAENVQVPASVAATTTPATIAQYAASIISTLKQAFPTDYVAQSFTASTDPTNQEVGAFLNKSSDFDFATTGIDSYLTAHPAALAGLTADQVTTVTDRLKAAQRVFRVINDGDVMQSLIGIGLDSAYAIAATPSGSFLTKYANTLGGETQAQQIYANATNITGVTSLIIRQAQEGLSKLMPRVIPGLNSTGSSSGKDPLSDALPNWQELFGTTSECQCCECRSIDGPAAYFVSLLQFLGGLGENAQKNTPLDVLIGSANSGHGNVTNPRRPDLAHLKLNCANADTALPYVDLVNEIMESYVANGQLSNSTAHDTPIDATTAVLDVTPEYTQTLDAVNAYNLLNGNILYPYSLPFDRYLETVRTYLNFLGVTLYQLMQTFGNPAPPLQAATQQAAEFLLISPPEYELITDQDFSANLLALIPLANYFGYTSESVPLHGSWDSLILPVPNFLSRTGLAFADLVTLLGTNYLNPEHLDPPNAVTLNIPVDPCDTTSMQLQLPPATPVAAGVIPKLPFLSSLPPFLRLWNKLGWQISELDYALRAFGELTSASHAITQSPKIAPHPPGGGGTGPTAPPDVQQANFIPADFILIAAQIQQLTKTLNLSISDVVSLWADIDTDGRSSPFVTLFQNKAVVNPPDSAYQLIYSVTLSAAPSNPLPSRWPDNTSQASASYSPTSKQMTFTGSMTDSQRDFLLSTWAQTDQAAVLAVNLLYSQRWYEGIEIAPTVVGGISGSFEPGHPVSINWTTEPVDNHISVILAALRIRASDLAAIRQDLGSNSGDRLSISNLSAFHRYAILAKALGLSIPDLITLKNLTGLQPFVLASGTAGPKTDPMVKFVAAAQQVAASQFSVPQLAFLYGAISGQPSSLAPLQATQDAVMATILIGLQNIAAANAFVSDPSGTALRKKLAVLLASTPLQLDPTMALIGGSAVYASVLPTPYPPLIPALPAPPAGQVSFVTTATIAGSITTGDSLTLQMTSSAVSGSPVSVIYQVQSADTFNAIASELAAQVNRNPLLIAGGISATVSGAVISLAAPPTMSLAPVWAFVPPPSPATVSEQVNFAGNLVCSGPMTDVTLASLSGLAGASATFIDAVQDLYNQAQDVLTENLGFLAAAGPYSTSLAALPANVTLPLGPVSFVTTLTVGPITAGELLSLIVTPSAGSPVTVTYSVLSTDTPNTVAAGLAAKITPNATLIAAGVSATVSGATISLVVAPTSTPSQVWTATTSSAVSTASPTETLTISRAPVVTPSDQVSSVTTATIGGTITPGDILSLATPIGGTPVPVSYTLQNGDTLTSAATALAALINSQASLTAANISATVSGAVISLWGPVTVSPLPGWTVSPSAALTLSGNLVSNAPMLNSTRTNLNGLAPSPITPPWQSFITAVETLYQQAWGSATPSALPTPNLIYNTQQFTSAEAYDYVLQGLLTYLTNTQSRNLVKQTLAQSLSLDASVVDLLLEGNPAFGVPAGLLPSNADPTQSAMSDFLGGLSATYSTSNGPQLEIDPGVNLSLSTTPSSLLSPQWTGKLLVPTTGAYNFELLVNGLPTNSTSTPQSTLTIDNQPVSLVTPPSPIVPINLTAGKMYDVFLTIPNAPVGAAISLQWRIAPAPLSTLIPIPALAFMPCDANGDYPTLALLYRIAVLVNGFSMSAEDVAYLSTHGADFAGTDPATGNLVPFSLAGLPAAAASDAPALFNQWQRLNALYTLKASLPVGNVTLFDVFAVAAAPGASLTSVSSAVVEEITAVTGWNPVDISTLTSPPNGFNFVDANFRNEISLVKMAACTSICSSIGISAQQLFTWANPAAATAPASPFTAIAQDIQNTVKAKYDQATWLQVGKPLNDTVRETTKEALINYILYLMPNPAYSTADDLYGFFLIDVEMCTCMETSRLVQASAAVQLFVQRCLLNLESQNPEPGTQIQPSAFAAADITEWNQWRKNYRVWQAAVEVFLYPENWIIPELRSNQTPFFEDLVTTLLKSDVTEDNVETAFLGYLEALQQVSRLEIIGLYTDDDTEAGTQITHVIGRTFTTPHVYFYRTLDNTTYIWSPWEKIDADISGDTLIPVIWNRRLFLFWPLYTEVTDPTTNNPTSSTISNQQGSNGQSTTTIPPSLPPTKTLQIQLAWSEYKSGDWTPKQLTADPLVPSLYENYSTKLDPSSFVYNALPGVPSQDGLTVNGYSIWREAGNYAYDLMVTVIVSITAGILSRTDQDGDYLVNHPEIASAATYLQSVQQYITFLLDSLGPALQPSDISALTGASETIVTITALLPPDPGTISQANKTTLLDSAKSVQATLANLALGYYTLLPLGSFSFDGSQGTVQIWTPAVPTGQILQIAALYGLTGNTPRVDGFAYQNLDMANSIFQLVLANAIAPVPVPLLLGSSGSLQSFTVSFPQQLLPLYSIYPLEQPFEKVAFYADSRRTYFVVNSPLPAPLNLTTPALANVAQDLAPQSFYFFNHYHPWVGEFIKRLNSPAGIPCLLNPYFFAPYFSAPATQAIDGAYDPPSGLAKFDFSSYYGADVVVNAAFADEIVDLGQYSESLAEETSQEPSSYPGGDAAYSIYNWEIFFYIPLLIATRLSDNQQFEDAETWFRYIFNPTADPQGAPPLGYSNGIPNCYWNFRPFNALPAGSDLAKLLAATTGLAADILQAQLNVWYNAPFDPDVIAEFRFVAYQKTVVMKYLDNLIAWGDNLFGQNTRESINEAIQIYILADQILGEKPVVIQQPGVVLDQTYYDLRNAKGGIYGLGNANVQLENAFPFVVSGTISQTGKPTGKTVPPSTPYFCTPNNPTLLAYYDTVADRLYKIRHCMNIQGQVEQLPLFSSPINPALLVAAEAAGVDLSSVLNDINAAVPHYRFTTMMGKALELCSEVRSLGGSLLSALEKSDAEGLALLRAGQEVAVQQAVLQLKQLQVQEANANLAGLQQTLAVTTARQTYYQGLVQGGLSGYENAQLAAMALAEVFKMIAQTGETTAATAYVIPQFDVGVNGVMGTPSAHVVYGGVQIAGAASSVSRAFGALADISSFVASSAGLMGGWDRRASEWSFQLETATLELTQIQQQINAAQFRIQIATQDVSNQNLLIANASAVQSTLQSKFTNQDLYQWMIGQVSAVFFQCYQMAYDLAKRAEACYRFELGIQSSSYIQFGYWDSLKQGLLSGEKLFQDLKRLEVAYLDQNQREYEISKSISLLLLDPNALISLKLTGTCLINLPEAYFDMDYPGHYMRRIKSLSLTIPCVTGPYTSVNCTLTLQQSRIRFNNIGGNSANTYAEQPVASDPRFFYTFSATESIATSTAQNDSGMFEVNFRDERYLPFEGSGVISQWLLCMPPDCNAFDFDTITDLILNLRYTARNGGAALLKAAKQAAVLPPRLAQSSGAKQPPSFPNQTNLQRCFSLRHEYPSEWYKLLQPAAPAPAGTTPTSTMQINLSNDRFPFEYRAKHITITQADLFVVPDDSNISLGTTSFSLSPANLLTSVTLTSGPDYLGAAQHFVTTAPPPDSPATPGGPNAWVLQYAGDLSTAALADIYLVVQYSTS